MPRSTRRDLSKPGVAGLTAHHLEALEVGHLTMTDIGRELGCSRQALSKAIKKLGVAKPLRSAPMLASTAPGDVRFPIDLTNPDAITGILNGAGIALLAVLARDLTRMAVDDSAVLGPSAAKAAAQALVMIRADLNAAGILTLPETASSVPTMKVHVMTVEEEEEMRASIETEALAELGLPSKELPPGLAGRESFLGTTEINLAHQPQTPPQSASELDTDVVAMLTRTTDPDELRASLSVFGKMYGAVMLRQIASSYGLHADRQESHQQLIERIVSAWLRAA